MTDFYEQLERDLHAAASRQARWGRLLSLPRGTLRALAALAAAAAAVTFVPLLAGSEAEREAAMPAPASTASTCGAAGAPASVVEAFAVLRRPATASDVLPAALARQVDTAEYVRPAKVFPDAARRARGSAWVLPVLVGDPCEGAADGAAREPGACLVVDHPDAQAPRCGTLAELRRGIGITDLDRPDGTWLGFALVPDGLLPALEHPGATRVEGDQEGNVWRVTYDGDAQTARFFMRDDGPAPAGEPSVRRCGGFSGPGEAPAVVAERFPVLRGPQGPPPEFRLDEPDVARAYGADARSVRYGSGLEVLAVPVMIGGCEPPDGMPGVCVVPLDESWPTECQVLPRERRLPLVVALRRADEHGETQVAGIASEATADAVVTWPGGRLEDVVEAGRVEATVPHGEPAEVDVTPVARP